MMKSPVMKIKLGWLSGLCSCLQFSSRFATFYLVGPEIVVSGYAECVGVERMCCSTHLGS